jgi:lipoprotein-releasing system permease protein
VYKLLLCWRYLRTRYLALLCIFSVMLGVATLIVVNSVMGGFSSKLRERLHGLLSDVVIEAYDYNGFAYPEETIQALRDDPFLDEHIEAMTFVVEAFAMIQFEFGGSTVTRTVRLIGVDPEERGKLGGFSEHLVYNHDRDAFYLGPEGQLRYERIHPPRGLPVPDIPELGGEPQTRIPLPFEWRPDKPGAPGKDVPKPPPAPPPSRPFVPEKIIVGHALAHFRRPHAHLDDPNQEIRMLERGDDVTLTTVSGAKLKPVWARFVVCDYFRSEMSEYDANYVYVPRDYLQKLCSLEHRATSIQIRLKHYQDAPQVVQKINEVLRGLPWFQVNPVTVSTWEDKQGPLLAAIRIERGLLNVLLFLIIAVAGFGILAIFSMIVVEKTRDIGILKALGASNLGVMKIFLGYGLLLGVVGCLLGSVLGIYLTSYINEVEHALAVMTGQEIFPRNVYYFDQIPTYISPGGVILINIGAVIIAVVFSVLPALRAAFLHPVRALRYE